MRSRTLLALLAVTAVVVAAPLQAAPTARQREEGSIRLEMPHPVYADGCLGLGAQYQFAWLHQPALNGMVGYQFGIKEHTWGRKFELVPSDERADLDIAFFPRFMPLIVTEEYVPYASRRYGGESGIVPRGMTEAIVCLHSGSEVEFRYTAGY